MDVYAAATLAQKPVTLACHSSAGLAAQVAADETANAFHPSGLTEIAALHGPQRVTIADVLLQLALATRPQHETNIWGMSLYWSLLRYLGALDVGWGGQLEMTPAGSGVRGNQRRVLSEELGIALAGVQAQAWAGPCQLVDVDAALADEFVDTAWGRVRLRHVGRHRPDYILVTPAATGRQRLTLLECKGTSNNAGHHITQLRNAGRQLRGIAVGHALPAGLAVASVINNQRIVPFSLALPPGRIVAPSDDQQDDGAPGEELFIDVNRAEVTEPAVQTRRDDPSELALAAIRAEWALLADIAGNDEAFRRWAPSGLARRLRRGSFDRRASREVVGSDGVRYVGTISSVSVTGGQLSAFLGVSQDVNEALSTGRGLDVDEAQQRSADRRREQGPPQTSTAAQATTGQGACLILSAE